MIDVGCGSSILSMFAAKAGAKRVYGVDNSNIVSLARELVKENNLQHKISIIHGNIESDLKELRGVKADIIISEWMGYFLLNENMLKSIIYAWDKYLKREGHLFPSHARIKVAGYRGVDGDPIFEKVIN